MVVKATPDIKLEQAKLEWRDNTPYSANFDDVYFSRDDGPAEASYVFLQQNHLKQRFVSLEASHFVIGETGFGTGLNFLLTCQLWEQYAEKNKTLFFISTEKYPLGKNDLEKAHSHWPELTKYSSLLLQQYPVLVPGFHFLEISDHISLILLLGDAEEGFSELPEHSHPAYAPLSSRCIDAWFMDGFAPAKNPSMWNESLFNIMANLSKPGTTVSTFTAAGIVKRGLASVGFDIKKVKGFGKKRDMITAVFEQQETPVKPQASIKTQAWPAFWPINKHHQNRPDEVTIIGAGIAGCTTAWQLAKAGIRVTLIDKHDAPMMEASGNSQAVLFPKLSHRDSLFAAFNLQSLLYAMHFYKSEALQDAFHQCGLIQLIDEHPEKAEALHDRFSNSGLLELIDASTCSDLANTSIHHPGIYYPEAGWLEPKHLAEQLLDNDNITWFGNTEIVSFLRDKNQWQLTDAKQVEHQSQHVVICNAHAANKLLDYPLPLNQIRGQVSIIESPETKKLDKVICHDGYLCPSAQAESTKTSCGATYDLDDSNTACSELSDCKNLESLARYLDGFVDSNVIESRVGFRCTTPDYMPVIGPVPDHEQFLQDYQTFAKNRKAFIPTFGTYQPGLYLNTGYGSRGFTSAPVGAALIRAMLLNEPYPLSSGVLPALNPARFLIKAISRREYEKQA